MSFKHSKFYKAPFPSDEVDKLAAKPEPESEPQRPLAPEQVGGFAAFGHASSDEWEKHMRKIGVFGDEPRPEDVKTPDKSPQ